jgi:hypothetical protein
MALVIWGFFVNRRRAWRTDGGTAAFGFGAMVLAAISTSGNFVAVAEDGIDWLQHLLFAAILWQTWLGWWWWVGSGMGIGEVEVSFIIRLDYVREAHTSVGLDGTGRAEKA